MISACLSGMFGYGYADQTDPRLAALFDKLKVADSPSASAVIERNIWQIWLDARDEKTQGLVDLGVNLMGSGQLRAALSVFDEVVSSAPDYAEGWNKRATIHYMLDNLDHSLADIEATLRLEPNHFGALSGRGLVFIKRGEYENALAAFEDVLKVGPQISGVRANIETIRKLVGQRDI